VLQRKHYHLLATYHNLRRQVSIRQILPKLNLRISNQTHRHRTRRQVCKSSLRYRRIIILTYTAPVLGTGLQAEVEGTEQRPILTRSSGPACTSSPPIDHTILNTPILLAFSKGLQAAYVSSLHLNTVLRGVFEDALDLLYFQDAVAPDSLPTWYTPRPEVPISQTLKTLGWVRTNCADLTRAIQKHTEHFEFETALERFGHVHGSHDQSSLVVKAAAMGPYKRGRHSYKQKSSNSSYTFAQETLQSAHESQAIMHRSQIARANDQESGHDCTGLPAEVESTEQRPILTRSSGPAHTLSPSIDHAILNMTSAEDMLRQLTDFYDLKSSASAVGER
jgi:hypothetical protein